MSYLLSFVICFLLSASTKAQTSYAEAIQQGDAAFKNQEYKKAINKYFAAEAFDPGKKDEVKAKVNLVFDRIEKLRVEAEKAKKEKETAIKKVIESETKAVSSAMQLRSALDKAEKLISTFYFYEDKFALAYKSPGVSRAGIQMFYFYYIDKNGDQVERLGKWDEAGPFKETGFATVKRDDGQNKLINYMVDTFGHTYPSASDIKNMDSSILALDLSGKEWEQFPDELMQLEQLQVFILSGTYFGRKNIFTVPESIGRLKNLENLQMAYCSIDTIAPQISRLANLKYLDLRGNKISELPAGIGDLKGLEILDLRYNDISVLPPEIGKLEALTDIKLGINNLKTLPPEIGKLKNLRQLSLLGNSISKPEQEEIKKLLPNCVIKF